MAGGDPTDLVGDQPEVWAFDDTAVIEERRRRQWIGQTTLRLLAVLFLDLRFVLG